MEPNVDAPGERDVDDTAVAADDVDEPDSDDPADRTDEVPIMRDADAGAGHGAEVDHENAIDSASDAEDDAAEDGDDSDAAVAEVVVAEVVGESDGADEPEVLTPLDPDDLIALDPDELESMTPLDLDEPEVLTPLDPDDLIALDPSSLEEHFDDDDDELVDVSEPPDMGPASDLTADDLTSNSVLRGHVRPPQAGWRRWIYAASGGLIAPRVSRSERERSDRLSAIRTLVTQPRRITVLSRKGGVGKTTTTLMLGQTLASERGDRIVAVDGNPDAGNLGYRVGPHRPESSITDLLNELDGISRYADVRRFTGQTRSGLEVLMSDDDPQISTAFGEYEYAAVLSVLDRFYNLVLIDTGTGILDSAVQGILDGTDQIVLVVAPSLDAARAASQTLDWLTEHGFVGLVETAVTVINQTRRSTLVDVARIEEHFFDRCGATVRVPWDRYLEAGAETELSDLRPATREAYMQLAASVARRFDG